MRHRDPLHISYADLVIEYDGVELYLLNKSLLDKQLAWGNLEEIKEAHWLKNMIYDMIRETDDHEELKSLALDITEIEFELQALWGLTKDPRYHRFWETPKCSCPKIDNMDSYPYQSIRSLRCILHG